MFLLGGGTLVVTPVLVPAPEVVRAPELVAVLVPVLVTTTQYFFQPYRNFTFLQVTSLMLPSWKSRGLGHANDWAQV